MHKTTARSERGTEMHREPFIWNGIEHWTGADLMETVLLISDEDEAADFMEAYTAACDDEDHAIHNLRYMLDILAHDSDNDDARTEAEQQAELFMVELPAKDETLAPRNWWTNSSCGVKVAA